MEFAPAELTFAGVIAVITISCIFESLKLEFKRG